MRFFGVFLSILAHSLALILFGHVWVLDKADHATPLVWEVEIVSLPTDPPQPEPESEALQLQEPEPEAPVPDDPDLSKPEQDIPEEMEPHYPAPEAVAQAPEPDIPAELPPGQADKPLPPPTPQSSASPAPGPEATPIPGKTRYQDYFDSLFGPIAIDQAHEEEVTVIDRDRVRPEFLPDETQPSPDDVYFGRDTLKQGNEIRLSLRALADYDFQQEDFIGLYSIGPRRMLNILDGREEYGALLIHDSETGLFRDLSKTGKYIYTYGPSFGEAEPVQGTILFLPQVRESDTALQKPSRLSWTPAEPPMEMAVRADVVEEAIDLGEQGGGVLVRPWGKAGLPCVILLDDKGRSTMLLAMARILAARSIAVFLPQERTPENTLRDQAWSLLGAVRKLKQLPCVDGACVGLWGMDQASLAVLKGASMGGDVRFCIITPSPDQDYGKGQEEYARQAGEMASDIYSPMLWLVVSASPDRDFHALLETGQMLALQGKALLTRSLASPAFLPPEPDALRDGQWLQSTLMELVGSGAAFILEQ